MVFQSRSVGLHFFSVHVSCFVCPPLVALRSFITPLPSIPTRFFPLDQVLAGALLFYSMVCSCERSTQRNLFLFCTASQSFNPPFPPSPECHESFHFPTEFHLFSVLPRGWCFRMLIRLGFLLRFCIKVPWKGCLVMAPLFFPTPQRVLRWFALASSPQPI